MPRIALVGDYRPEVLAHQAIPLVLDLGRRETGLDIEGSWLNTTDLTTNPGHDLAGFEAVWCVPASPYLNTSGVLATIRYVRENGIPFLGTCGGYQHAIMEFAEAGWGIENPAHAELDPEAAEPVISPLTCSLVEVDGEILFAPGSRLREIYGTDETHETYHCRYGLNPKLEERMIEGPLRLAATDRAGDVRAFELDGHPFFFGTGFQPERSGLIGKSHPLVNAFIVAASR